MKNFCCILLFNLIIPTSCIFGQDEFELVESVPVETIFENSTLPRTLDVWLKMIGDARTTIDIETFYFANEKGQPLEKVMNALKDAAGRGVKIRIIVDSSFYSNSEKSVDELAGIENIEIKKIPMGNLSGGVMHSKHFIVDNENLFIGSQNMDWRALIHIHEIGVRVKSKKLARTFAEMFETDWKLCDHINDVLQKQSSNEYVNSKNLLVLNTDNFGDIVLYPAFSPPDITVKDLSLEEEELLRIINNSKERLLIQLYSYSPKAKNWNNKYDSLDNALREAAARGVNVKVIFSDWSIKDGATEFIKSLSEAENIQIKFSTVPQFRGGFIPYSRVEHQKFFVSDHNISWISTSNWEWGYFYNSRNSTLIIYNEKVNEALSKIFYADWDGPYTEFVDVNRKYEYVKRK